jgi:hypothetical protein
MKKRIQFFVDREYMKVYFSICFSGLSRKKLNWRKDSKKQMNPFFFVFYLFSKRKKALVDTFLYQRKKSVNLFCLQLIEIAFETVKRKKYPFIFL